MAASIGPGRSSPADERRAIARAISALRLTPVMFEVGARPYPPRDLYRAYVAQSDVFIGLYWHTSSSKISLTNWTLRDAAGHVFKFATYTLGAHSYVKIHTGHGTRTQTDRYWNQSWYIWNNTGDTATLRDPSGGTVDSCHYTGTSAGYVFC